MSEQPPALPPDMDRFDADTYFLLYPDVLAALGNNPEAARAHWLNHGRLEGRTGPGIAPYRGWRVLPHAVLAKPFGINIFGPFAAVSGLGTAARGLLRAVQSVGAWCFPPPPHAGHIKDITFDGNRLMVGIEIGALLLSQDFGESFVELPIDNNPVECDIHRIVLHADRPNRLIVANGIVGLMTSEDRGRTWTRPVRVNTDPVHNGSDQFFQWLAVDPSDGSADIVFYDRRDDPDNRRAIVVLARSTNGGQSFTNYAWSDRAFDPGDQFIGDYTALTALNGRVYGAWTETVSTAGAPRTRLSTKSTLVRIGVADFQMPNQPAPQ